MPPAPATPELGPPEELPAEGRLLDINENRGEDRVESRERGDQRVFTEEEIVARLDAEELARSQREPSRSQEEEPLEASFRSRHNLDIALLSRHIDHMQRICRASLTDLTLSRQRRQIIRLQGIRRMLEDLQRQIRTLQASSELTPVGDEAGAPQEPEAGTSGQAQRFPVYPSARHRHLLPRVRRSSSASLGPLRTQTMLASRSRLSRAHNQLVSQLRATFRAMEMSPDLGRRETGDLLATASQSVLEHTEVTSTRPLPLSLQGSLSPR